MCELIYDFFVVLARSGVVLAVQLVWLLALVPALIAGTRADGIAGAAMAEVAVSACVVLPCYLSALSRVGIRRRDLAARLWAPLAVATAVGGAAELAARAIPADLTALAVGALAAAAGFGLLARPVKGAVATLRLDLLARPAVAQAAAAPAAARPRGAHRRRRTPPAKGHYVAAPETAGSRQ
jgi:PST family polysaccharide transporter